jgi:hypothetical protein
MCMWGVCDCRRGMGWRINLLTTYIHHSEPQVITALLLFSTIHRSPQHLLSVFPACCVFNSRSLAVASNIGDSSGSRPEVLSPRPPVQNSTLNWQLTTKWVPGWRPFHTNLHRLTFNFQLTTNNVIVFKITSRRGPHRKHRSSIVVRCSFPRECVYLAVA